MEVLKQKRDYYETVKKRYETDDLTDAVETGKIKDKRFKDEVDRAIKTTDNQISEEIEKNIEQQQRDIMFFKRFRFMLNRNRDQDQEVEISLNKTKEI